ncbi:MAG TPA: lanthionine synthetase LanC family protein, partial [Elusimicrobiota bacterium]|nr:lanthionine synthetase LanC family protein [Elusimicrobiota bacterium]
ARVLLRGTQDYLEWLNWSTAPDLLVSEEAFEGALDRFGFTEPEREALRRHDVPLLERPSETAAASRRLRSGPAEAAAARRVAAAALRLPSIRLEPRRGEPLLAHARAIGELLGELAVPGPRGPVWLGLARTRGVGRDLSLTTTDPFLYAGGAGVALFLAALAEISGRGEFRRLADETFDGCLATIRGAALPRSGFTGAGSLLYALAASGRSADAARLVPGPGPADADVLNGDAGLCLALLALHRRRRSPRALAAARLVGEGLLRAAPAEGAGFGHGPAGTASALLRLHAATDEARWLKGGRRLLEVAEPRRESGGWCSGAVGLDLARLEAGLPADAAPLPSNARHNLCCGEAGRVVLLARAGRLGDARRAAKELIAFGKARGAWRFQGFYERPFIPGLMGGVSGIGLALLTALEPDAAPDVLRLG